MTSSIMTSEQRWASKRRGGMTVLGKVAKVAVPKPLNLPSQRLENHGLDPNVEIVPKGTHSWGSRPSSSWGTSAVSPRTDGGSSSPIHLSGRPFSSGSTRSSTAGSEKAHDSNVNTWSPNSRPSSASGVSGTNHTSLTSLRPRSADTRPGSSHLSRFGEHSAEGFGGFGGTASSEQTGVSEGFSLISGDFPTLGLEKEEPKRSSEPLDDCREQPGSSHGEVKSMSDCMEIAHDDARHSDIRGHSWREDRLPFVEGGPLPNMERWHGDPHMYQNPNIGPPHHDSWHGALSVDPQGGVWYRGPPPYHSPIPPEGFHMDPFPYYRLPGPPPGLSDSRPIHPEATRHGHHPKNGDMYRPPHLPDSFMRPGAPMRPGFYPASVPYDGYCGPSLEFCNLNERDLPFMGRSPRPIYSRATNQNAPDINNTHPRPREGSGWSDSVDPAHNPRRNYRVLVKRNDVGNHNGKEKWGHRVTTDESNHERGILSKPASTEKHESFDFDHTVAKDEVPSLQRDNRFHSSKSSYSRLSGSATNVEESCPRPATDLDCSRDHLLIQKIAGLNAKARALGGSYDAYNRKELTERVQVSDVSSNQSVAEANTETVLERHYPSGVLVPVSRDSNIISRDKIVVSIIGNGPRRAMNEAQNRANHRGYRNFDQQEASRWGRKSQPHSVRSADSNLSINDQGEDQNSAVQPTGVLESNIELEGDEESTTSILDPNDAQRAKMREIARQRAIQLQKEEEERRRERKAKAVAKLEELNRRAKMREIARQHAIQLQKEEEERRREQKAKALAKLEELNRRGVTLVAEVSSQKETVPPYPSGPRKPDSRDQAETEQNSHTVPSSGFSNKIAQKNEKGDVKILDQVATSKRARERREESNKDEPREYVSSKNESPIDDAKFEDVAGNSTTIQVRDVPKHKRASHKLRQSFRSEKTLSLKSVATDQTPLKESQKIEYASQERTVAEKVDGGAGKEQPEKPFVSNSPAPPKRRNNKSRKNKHKAEDLSGAVLAILSLPNDSDRGQEVFASSGANASTIHSNSTSAQLSADAKAPSLSVGNHSSLSHENDHVRVNNVSRAQHSRKARNFQGNRLLVKPHGNDATVVWAPVRSHDKVDIPGQTSQKAAAEPLSSSAVGDKMTQSSSKSKRAEMERYVPKPVAKELAQQGSILQPLSPSTFQVLSAQAPKDPLTESGGREKASQGSSSVEKPEPVVEGKSRHARGSRSWRQRASSAESNAVQPSKDYTDGNTSENTQLNRPPGLSMNEPDASLSDGWNSATDSSSVTSPAFTVIKDPNPSGRGRRHPFKAKNGSRKFNNFDHNDSSIGLPDKVKYAEKMQSSKENRAVADRSASHWQPKTQVYVAQNQQENWSNGSTSHTAEDGKGVKTEIGSTLYDSAMQDGGQQEFNQDKRGPHVKWRPHSQHPKQGLQPEVEFALSDTADGCSELQPSGHVKNSNRGGRVTRVHESRGDWNLPAPESKQHYSFDNRGRHRQNSHYEYQAVESHDSNNSNPHVEHRYGGGQQSRGRGYSRRGRGNIYARQSANE